MESTATTASDTASIMSFTCSLSKEFDRRRTDVDSANASVPDFPAGAATKAQLYGQTQNLDKKQAWLDTTFNKLSARYRAPKKGANQKGAPSVRPAKPHFLDLSSIICPIPARNEPNASTEDEEEAGDRSSSSSSSASTSFNSGPDSSFEAMSGWDNSSADTSLELRTPQNEEDRQLACNAYDSTTPRPSQMQRFASANSAATSRTAELRLPSPPLISPLMPNFALPSSGASTPGLAPAASAGSYGFPLPPQTATRGVTLDDIHHKPSNAVPNSRGNGLAPPGPLPAGIRQLRKQKSFDNPAELRRRQKQEWSIGGPMPPGFGGNANLTIGIPKAQHLNQPSQHGLRDTRQVASPRLSLHPGGQDTRPRNQAPMQSPAALDAALPVHPPLHNRVAEMQARPLAMQRGLSHDTAGALLQHHSAGASASSVLSPPQRPGLIPRASSSALHTLDTNKSGPALSISDIDPASSTGFSTSLGQQRQGCIRSSSDRHHPVQLSTTSPLQSPVGGSVPLPLLLPASSRESYDSSVDAESLPPTPLSATFLRGLPLPGMDESTIRIKPTPSSPRDVRIPRELQQMQQHATNLQHGAGPPMSSALGLMPAKMARAYSDSPFGLSAGEGARVRTGSRLRGESISSQDDGGDEHDAGTVRRNVYASQTTPRQKIRPELRREHTSNAIMVSPPKPQARRPLNSRAEHPVGTAESVPTVTSSDVSKTSLSASANITPRSSSLKDLLAAESQGVDICSGDRTAAAPRASLDSESSDSSLAYTKPSPLLSQGAQTSGRETAFSGDGVGSNSNNITPTNSYRTDLLARGVATPTAANGESRSKWSPDNSPTKPNGIKSTTSVVIGARQRANSHADEWAANLRKFTARGGNHPLQAAAAGK